MSQSFITLRPVRKEDGAALAEIRARAMQPSLEALGRFDPQRVRSRFLESFTPEYTRGVFLHEQLVGVLVVRPVDAHLLLDHLYIEPLHHSAGIGSAVLETVIRESREIGKALRVGALKGSKSNHFYLRRGFELESEGEWDNYYALQPSEA